MLVVAAVLVSTACAHPLGASRPELLVACINKISPDACPANTALACEEKALTDCRGEAEGSVVKKEAGAKFGCLVDNGVSYACKIIVEKPCTAGQSVKITKAELTCGPDGGAH
jgi:hypothetical protein